MKQFSLGKLNVVAVGAALFTGCAGPQKLVISDPVGPFPDGVKATGTDGSLIVYSGWDGLDTLDTEHPKHTDYILRSEDGKKLKRIRNRCGSFEGDPEIVGLSPGRYWIEAEATNVGPIKVPAVIRPHETTTVYLDGTTEPGGPWPDGTNWVWEPNGLVVGWKAQASLPARQSAAVNR
jgi:hypothetical protein